MITRRYTLDIELSPLRYHLYDLLLLSTIYRRGIIVGDRTIYYLHPPTSLTGSPIPFPRLVPSQNLLPCELLLQDSHTML